MIAPGRSSVLNPISALWPSSRGYRALALTAATSLLAVEYLGPVIAIVAALVLICGGLLLVVSESRMVPKIPSVAYWLLAIFVIGLASSIASNLRGSVVEPINLERDIGIIVSYAAFLVAGYVFAYDTETRRLGLAVLVIVAAILSAVYVVNSATTISGSVSDLYQYRLDSGRGSQTQCAGIFASAMLMVDRSMARFRRLLIIVAGIITFSVFLTLSRGLIFDLLIVAVVVTGVALGSSGVLIPDAARLFSFAAGAFLAYGVVYYFFLWFLPNAFHFISEEFVTRLVNSISEVATSNLETRDQITANYRAFELANVVRVFSGGSDFTQWFGQGWGSSLKFGFETAGLKSHFTRTEAAFLHNGYAYYLMKTGLLGLFMYVIFLIHLAVRAILPKAWASGPGILMQRKILLACVVALAINTLTTGGLGFPIGYLGLVMLIGMCYTPVWGRSA